MITNSSLVERGDVRDNLAEADLVVATLVSDYEDTFRAINRPVDGIILEHIINGLKAIKDMEIRLKFAVEVCLFIQQ